MSLHKNTVIQFRVNEDYKKEIQNYCNKKDIKISEYMMNLIKGDLGLSPKSKKLVYGVDWEL